MKPLRSLLFVPGNKAAWMEKAPQYGADALILDLEDSVPHTDKDTALRWKPPTMCLNWTRCWRISSTGKA